MYRQSDQAQGMEISVQSQEYSKEYMTVQLEYMTLLELRV
jgi:hypothetical protein